MKAEQYAFPYSAIVIDLLGVAFLTLGLLGMFAPDLATRLLPVLADQNTAFVCIGIGAAMILYAVSQFVGYARQRARR